MNSKRNFTLIAIGLWFAFASVSLGQRSSLYNQDLPVVDRQPLSLSNGSWLYRKVPPPKEVRMRDIVTIRVDEKSQSFSEGQVERRKTGLYDAILKDWLILDKLKAIHLSPQSQGDPRVNGTLNQLYRAEADMETRESVKFDIAAEIVDIRPNGTLVLEAHRIIRNGEETWEYSLTGICRRDDIGPDNVIFSQDIAELSLAKNERGTVASGYRRGWLFKLMDLFQPF